MLDLCSLYSLQLATQCYYASLKSVGILFAQELQKSNRKKYNRTYKAHVPPGLQQMLCSLQIPLRTSYLSFIDKWFLAFFFFFLAWKPEMFSWLSESWIELILSDICDTSPLIYWLIHPAGVYLLFSSNFHDKVQCISQDQHTKSLVWEICPAKVLHP